MRLPLPAQAPTWLQGVLRAIENAFREIMPAPFRLKPYATADLPDAADFSGGLVFDSTTSTPKISTGSAWSGLVVSSALGTAAYKNTGTSGDAVPLLNGENTWSAAQTFAAVSGTNITASGSVTIGSGGTYAPGSIYSDPSSGMRFRAYQPSPTGAEFLWFNSAGTELARLTATALSIPSGTTASAANLYQGASGSALLRSTSSRRYKTEIADLDDLQADRLLTLRPVRYRSTSPHDDPTFSYYGLVAEEVAGVDPRFVHYAFQEDQLETVEVSPGVFERRPKAGEVMRPDGVQYERLTIPILKFIKRIWNRLDRHQQRLIDAEARIKKLEDRLAAALIP